MKLIAYCLFLFSLSLYASNEVQGESLLERLRPYVRQYLGSEMEVKILGAAEIKEVIPFEMPLLPKVIENATSTEVFNKKEDKVVLPQETEAKFYVSFIKETYEVVRKKKPSEEEIGKFFNVLNQGGTREGIYRALVLDEYYAELENADAPLNNKQKEFAMSTYEKYLGRKITAERLAKINVFSLKRFLVERALEIIDGYGTDRESLEKWYAYLSREIAVHHGVIFTNSIRKEKDLAAQKDWASKVPLQHLKSEVIIKLHFVLNSL